MRRFSEWWFWPLVTGAYGWGATIYPVGGRWPWHYVWGAVFFVGVLGVRRSRS